VAKQYGIKNFVRIANAQLNPDLDSFEGMKQYLINWFCFKYSTTENDDKLLDMTFEELMVLYQKHCIHEDPKYFDEIMNPQVRSYEDWLKEEMGEDYATEEENIEMILKEQEDYTEKVHKKYPDEITTDFSKFKEDN